MDGKLCLPVLIVHEVTETRCVNNRQAKTNTIFLNVYTDFRLSNYAILGKQTP